jgi:RHS repeat-associated protein
LTPDATDKFATYFRDGFGQDYANARYYNSNLGRFWSPDPSGIKAVRPKRPISWNRYVYASDDPVNRVDLSGNQDDSPTEVYVYANYPYTSPTNSDSQCAQSQCTVPPNPNPTTTSAGNGPGATPTMGPVTGQSFAGFNQARAALLNNKECASLIAGSTGATAQQLSTDLWNADVTTGTSAQGNGPVSFTTNADGTWTGTWQFAYTLNGAIQLNGNYFPDPTQQNITLPTGTTTSLLQLVNQSLGTNMNATQFGEFAFLHEDEHIAGQNAGDIDNAAAMGKIVSTCIK